ncbi:GNAT family N-acetyltransferase [Hymenobacter sp. BT491]|uniref:GNAT family N-acetyltransferase n=1 Tax=Hymenobacter sp. BT491 TaxID=2766779 RepID=UPI0016534C07|nr:GNAT family N-acetyltransferase [Hymenobacter sp. BT491]MBC6990176.1 GNAT family N-acetyltransferase [Hymenobacter sp. BT491]
MSDPIFSAAQLTSKTVLECTSAELSEAMNRSFENYFVPLHFDAASFERRFRGENLDASASRLWFCGEALVGVVYIARRGWTSRVAAMGLVMEARGLGLGKVMLQTAIDEAIARNDHSLMLEVFTVNEPAIRLYERLGFQKERILTGFQRKQTTPASADSVDQLTEIDPLVVARLVTQEGDSDLPWMITGETLAAATAPVAAWHLAQNAYALVRPEASRVLLLSLVVPKAVRRQGWATRLLRALETHYAEQPLVVPPLLPPGTGQAFLQGYGWEATSLQLFEMDRLLP